MNLLSDLIDCTICKDIIESPVVLPCGHSICKYHVDEAAAVEAIDDDEKRKIVCAICDVFHEIPENGFARNRVIEHLFEKEIESIDLGVEYTSAREKCYLFSSYLDLFKKLIIDPEMRIHTVISELRNKIDLRREELKGEIDKEALAMIEKLEDFEKQCKSNVALVISDNRLKLQEWENDLEQWKLSLNTFKKHVYKWNEILNKATCRLKELQSEFIQLNNNLFLNRLDQLRCTSLFVSSNFHTISVEVKELSKYKHVKERINILSHDVKAVGIDWRLAVYVGQQDEKEDSTYKTENYIGIYLFASQKPRIRNIKVDCDLMILDQLGMNKSKIRKVVNVFDSDHGHGYTNFINLRDLMNNFNLYNAQNDSCTVQAIIKRIEWL